MGPLRGSALLLLVLASAAPAKAQADIAFAFANRAGTHLLTVPMEESGPATSEAGHLGKALCAGNRLLEVAFEEHQPQGPKDTGRQISYNFEQSAGDRYRITNGNVGDDEICMLGDEDFFADRQILPLERWKGVARDSREQPDDCGPHVTILLSAVVKRRVKHCSVLGDLRVAHFLAMEFAPAGKDLLAALALVGEGKTRLRQERAQCEEASGWRVDDGCEFTPADLTLLFAWKEKDGEIALGIEWAAPEGGALILFLSSEDKLEEVARAYRYWSPL